MNDVTESPGRDHPYLTDVADANAGHGPGDPVELWMLHHAIDFRERDIIDVTELNRILRALSERGLIRELSGHRFVDASLGGGPTGVTDVSAAEWDAARHEYGRWFGRTYAELRTAEDEPTRAVALVRIRPTEGMDPTDAAFDAAVGPVADAIERASLDASLLRGAPEDAFVVQAMRAQDGERLVGLVRDVLDELGLGHAIVTLETVDQASIFELM